MKLHNSNTTPIGFTIQIKSIVIVQNHNIEQEAFKLHLPLTFTRKVADIIINCSLSHQRTLQITILFN